MTGNRKGEKKIETLKKNLEIEIKASLVPFPSQVMYALKVHSISFPSGPNPSLYRENVFTRYLFCFYLPFASI